MCAKNYNTSKYMKQRLSDKSIIICDFNNAFSAIDRTMTKVSKDLKGLNSTIN